MKTLLYIFLVLLSLTTYSQELHIDSTRFITGLRVGTDIAYAIPTADKGILFVGYDYGNPGGIIPYFPLDMVNDNLLVGKIDSNHQISWIKIYGGSGNDLGYGTCQTPDGGYAILAGTSSSDGDVSDYRGEIWLVRLDASGNLLWEKTFGSTQSDIPMSIANTLDGGFILLSCTNGSDGDVPFHYGSTWTFDWLVIKTDGSGNKQWSKDIGGTGDEDQQGSILSVDNSYYIVSGSNSTDHDCTDTAWHVGVNTSYDYSILKLDDTGKVLWDSSYGGSGSDGAYNALFDVRDSTIVMNGYTSSSDYMVTGYQGGGDMWVVKIKKDGTLVWQKALGSSQEEVGTGLCAQPDSGYMVYGSITYGPLGGEDAWLFCLNASGNEINNKIFGGKSDDDPNSIVPYQNSYVATGTSGSSVFTEGSCNINYSGAFVSYIDTSGHLSVPVVNGFVTDIMVYPNPASSYVYIHIPENAGGILTIINDLGQECYKQPIFQQTTLINIALWSSCVYCIRWTNENGAIGTAKFLKQ